jgi:hypothetical protein
MEVNMEPLWLSLIVLLVVLLIIWWLATRNRVPLLNCDTPLFPDTCDPDWLNGVQYVPLSELPASDCESGILDGEGKCTKFTYTNKGQKFTLSVEGSDQKAVQAYVNDAAVYFTVHKLGRKPQSSLRTPSLIAILVETITSLTGVSEKDFIERVTRAYMESKGAPFTLAGIVSSMREDQTIVKQILEAAISRAVTAYKMAGVDAEAVPDTMSALFNDPGAIFLLAPALLPQEHASERDELTNNPSSLVITLDWASAPKRNTNDSWIVWCSVDPTVRNKDISPDDTPHRYRTPRVPEASAQIRSIRGEVSGILKGTYPDASSLYMTASNGRPSPPVGDNISPNKSKFNVTIQAGPNAEERCTYTLTYTWRE